MANTTASRRSDNKSDGAYNGTWAVAHFLVILALINAFLFRDLLVPELLETQTDAIEQLRVLFLCAIAVAAPLMLIYAMTKRTARDRALLYHFGAWIFFGVTVYLIVQDYQQFGEPRSFSARINLAVARIEPLIGFELPRLP